MGLDLYIEARISEKSTGRIISCSELSDDGYFEVCYFRGHCFQSMGCEIAFTCLRNGGCTEDETYYYFPLTILDKIYECIEETDTLDGYEWKDVQVKRNLAALEAFLKVLEKIENGDTVEKEYFKRNSTTGKKSVFTSDDDLEAFIIHPSAYDISMRFIYSC